MMGMDHERSIGHEAARLVAVARQGPLDAPVPGCPGWDVSRLAGHVGRVHRWATASIVGRGEPDGTTLERPPKDDSVVDWAEGAIAPLLEALKTAPNPGVWNFVGADDADGSFWARRMAVETAIHRWDAQLATRLPEPIEGKLAADTVTEALDTFLAAGRRRTPGEATGLIHLTASDVGQEWYIRLRGLGVALLDTDTLLDDDAHPARAAASGSASDLALALWGRVAFDVVDTAGDPALLDALRVR